MTVASAGLESLLVRRDAWRLHLTLNRPHARNAIDATLLAELEAVVAALPSDPCRAVILRGAGGTFCAGGDLKAFAAATAAAGPAARDAAAAENRRFGSVLAGLLEAPQVIVAVVEGAAYAGGFGLACATDVTLCRADARFRLAETSIGLVPAQIAPFVAHRIGAPAARRLALTGATVDASEAARLGIASVTCASAQELDAALAAVLADVGRCAPRANAATKRLIGASQPTPPPELLDRCAREFADALYGEGAQGIAAFLQKRPPPWSAPDETVR